MDVVFGLFSGCEVFVTLKSVWGFKLLNFIPARRPSGKCGTGHFFNFQRPFDVRTSQNCCHFFPTTVSIVFKGLFSDETDETGVLVVFWCFMCELIFRNQLKMCPVSFSVAIRRNGFFKPVRTISSGTVRDHLFLFRQFFLYCRFQNPKLSLSFSSHIQSKVSKTT